MAIGGPDSGPIGAVRPAADTVSQAEEDIFTRCLIDFMPNLRAFARSLTRDINSADDLVQETLLKAITNREKFTSGTNQRAWLFTILRNTFLSDMRRSNREIPYAEGDEPRSAASRPPEQEHALYMRDVADALEALPECQRSALLMVGAQGHSYEDTAAAEQCAVGTVKSRVSRARRALERRLNGQS